MDKIKTWLLENDFVTTDNHEYIKTRVRDKELI